MKELSELTVAIIDAGTFIPLAEMFGRVVKRCGYYSPWEQEYLCLERCVIGDGMKHFERVDEYLDPAFFNEVDLWLFPDIGFGGFQRYLRSLGKLVWGSFGASDLELYRTRFLRALKDCGLAVVPSVTVRGVSALAEHLKGASDKWVKINRYRDNMETWHHLDWLHSQRKLEELAFTFGPLKEHVVFVVQDAVNDAVEVGYDGWLVTGPDGQAQFPPASFQGYERKNELYLGSRLDYDKLPQPVLDVNERFGEALAEYGYRNFWATEIRVKEGQAFFIDPTARMAGMTMEHLLTTCTNLPQVIVAGAQGEVLAPEFSHEFAAEATLHYTEQSEAGGWKTFSVPETIAGQVKLYRCCDCDGAYQFPPHKSDELGVICGEGDSIEESIEKLNENFEHLADEPVRIEAAGFAELLEEIQKAEDEGIEFSEQPVPGPEIAV